MAQTTRVAAAMDGLKAIIDARTIAPEDGIGEVRVSLGYPSPEPDREHIWISGIVPEIQREPGSLGSALEDEAFELTVICHVVRAEADYTLARNRAIKLGEEVEKAIRADRSLSAVAVFARVAGGALADGIDSGQRIVQYQIRIAVEAETLPT